MRLVINLTKCIYINSLSNRKLSEALSPITLKIENESHKHAGESRAGQDGEGKRRWEKREIRVRIHLSLFLDSACLDVFDH